MQDTSTILIDKSSQTERKRGTGYETTKGNRTGKAHRRPSENVEHPGF